MMFTVREAAPNDITILRQLEQKVIDAERPFNDRIRTEGAEYYDIEALVTSPDALLVVVESNKELIGTGYVQIRQSKPSLQHEKHGYLGFMFVSPEYRGQGINKNIIEHLMDWGKTKGVKDFYLDVYAGNQSAVKAYEKVGFTPSLVEMKLTLSKPN